MINFKWHEGIIAAALMAATPMTMAEVVFEENFDALDDWHGSMHTNEHALYRKDGDVLPEGWDRASHWPKYTPDENGENGAYSIEILKENSGDMTRGSSEKSAVFHRYGTPSSWVGDGIFGTDVADVDMGEGYEELYVRFWIKFQPGWRQTGQSKLLRINALKPGARGWSGEDVYAAQLGWGWRHWSSSGVRNIVWVRTDPYAREFPEGAANHLTGTGSLNFSSHLWENFEAGYGEQPELPNRTNDGTIEINDGKVVPREHREIYGSEWNLVEFYVKMNSGPGIQDGQARQWINGVLTYVADGVAWIREGGDAGAKWNSVWLSGNDNFIYSDDGDKWTEEERFHQWYAIDDLVIHSELPKERASLNRAPNPPANITVN